MSKRRLPNPIAATPFSAIRCGIQLMPHGLSLCVFMCSLFTAAAALFVTLALPLTGIEEDSAFYARIWLKFAAFTVLTLLSAFALRRLMSTFPPRLKAPPPAVDEAGSGRFLAVVMLAFALLVFPNLSNYPWTAPDELHHLSVVRNLAESGAYASGHPEDELLHFDSYDSVGPAVIVPVAAAYKASNGRLRSARLMMAAMFMLWLLATWLLVRPVVGGRPAVIGLALAGTAIGSVYLGRSVYGEVPALMYSTAGLLYWRMALGRVAHIPWSVLAGICLGLSVLSKTFLILTVFPIAAVWLFDRLSFRRIPTSRLVWPAVSAAATLGAWTVYQALAGGGAESAVTLHLYRHYLLFGFTSVDTTLGWIAGHWLATLVVVLGFLTMLPSLLLVRYDAPTLVLAMTGVLFAYWWIFFTPGQIPRYLWYTLAIGGLFAGPLLLNAARTAADRFRSTGHRVAAAVLVVCLVIPALSEVHRISTRMWFDDQMKDEYALEQFLSNHPDQAVVTTSWMAQRSANVFSNRHLPRIEPSQIGGASGFVIRDRALEDFDAAGFPSIGTGRYVLIEPDRPGVADAP